MSLKKEPFDETAKAFYQRLFKSWGLKVETEREVFSRSRTIDLVVACLNETDRARLQHTVFSHFRQLNAIELKGFHDPLTVDNLNRIIMRAWGLSVKKTPSTFTLSTGQKIRRFYRPVCMRGLERLFTIDPGCWISNGSRSHLAQNFGG